MFGEQFYPTPKILLVKAFKPYMEKDQFGNYFLKGNTRDISVLDPQAGKGDILDWMKELISRHNDFFAIEIDPNLSEILKGKGYPVIHDDFLTYRENYYWDWIVMNPPFKDGAKHLLHAISIARNTHIVCILNAETIRNPFSNERLNLLTQIDKYGDYEFVEEAFTEAERKTNVEAAIVRLFVPDERKSFDYDFSREKLPDMDFDFDIESNQLAVKDMVGNFQKYYEIVTKFYYENLKANSRFLYYMKNMLSIKNEKSDVADWEVKNYILKSGTDKQKYNHLQRSLKRFMWRQVIEELDVQKYMSSKVRENFEAFIGQQQDVSFTKENVARFFQMIMNNRVNIWEEAIADVFDVFTKHTPENREVVESWKTNERYKIARKVILPYWVNWQNSYDNNEYMRTYGKNFGFNYHRDSKYSDIDKCCAYILGEDLPYVSTINGALEQHFNRIGKIKMGQKFDNECESRYFKIKFFKKGTVHIYFKNKNLWQEFNYRACAHKNWLPADERRKWEKKKQRYKCTTCATPDLCDELGNCDIALLSTT